MRARAPVRRRCGFAVSMDSASWVLVWLNAFDLRPRYSFKFSLLAGHGALRHRWRTGGGARLAVQVPGRLRRDLRDVQRYFLLLSAALYGHGHVVRCLNGVEYFLTALRVVERRAVDRRDQIARLEPQLVEYLAISTRVGAKAAQFARGAVVRRHGAHDLIENTRILLHHATNIVDCRDGARVAAG